MTSASPALYLLTHNGGFFGAHTNEHNLVIGTQEISVLFALRKQLEQSATRKKPIDRTAYAIRDNPNRIYRNRRWTIGLTSDTAPYRPDMNFIDRVGICRCDFDLSKHDNPLTKILTHANSDIFIAHWVKYDDERDILQLHGERLSNVEYLAGTPSVSQVDHLKRSFLA